MSAESSLRRAGGIGSGALGRQPDSLADVLERVLDKGIVIVGDVVVNVLDIELLTLKLRLFVSSAETAREMGMDWWTTDPFFSGRPPAAVEDGSRDGDEVRALRDRVAELEELVRRAGLADGERALASREEDVTDELDRIARAAVPEVVAAALERARERAVDRLADLLTDAIVAQAVTGAVRAAVPAPRPSEDGAERPGPALYAYGITTAGLPVPDDVEALTGDAPLRLVTTDDLALLVSSVHADQLRVDEDDLSETGRLATLARGHDAVVRAAARTGPVLPLRFGTVVPDDAAARRLLDEHSASARQRLRRIGDAREWGVKLVRRLEQPVPVGPRPADRVGVTGTEYLTRRRQVLDQYDSAEAAAEETVQLLIDTLRPHVTDSVRRGGSPGSSLLLDLAVLVGADAEAAFLATAAELRQRLDPDGLEVEVSGPWPPYSFASLEDGDA